jgi:hypothetical protein
VTILSSASGLRVDCDACGTHAGSPDLSIAQLRRATAFIHHHGADLCPDCAGARGGTAPAPDESIRSVVGTFEALRDAATPI